MSIRITRRNPPPRGPGYATEKQIRYALYLLSRLGYSTRWMSSEYKRLGASMRERSGLVVDWLRSRTISEMSEIIDTLLDELKEKEARGG